VSRSEGEGVWLPGRASLRELASVAVPKALSQALDSRQDGRMADMLAAGSAPALTAALLALNAELWLTCGNGDLRVSIDDRLTIDGRVLPRAAEELQTVIVPAQQGHSSCLWRGDLGIAGVVRLTDDPPPHVVDAGIVWWGLAPAPFRAHQLAGLLRGRIPDAALIELAAQTARTEAQPAGAGMEVDSGRLATVAALTRDLLGSLLPID
jgi:CO/xanthine dehydrogenase FAD-binding subunit